ncbi:MAG: hypothetical protein KME17_03805 [Cyanosarcina radialis HA8281-LM2]|nr:hypothetical protein [Cyanosarcina radialis HA8281-LM2]
MQSSSPLKPNTQITATSIEVPPLENGDRLTRHEFEDRGRFGYGSGSFANRIADSRTRRFSQTDTALNYRTQLRR